MVQLEPNYGSNEPEVVQLEPGMVQLEPNYGSSEPEVVQLEPGMVQLKPRITLLLNYLKCIAVIMISQS